LTENKSGDSVEPDTSRNNRLLPTGNSVPIPVPAPLCLIAFSGANVAGSRTRVMRFYIPDIDCTCKEKN
jgi:hypothetical protein